MQAWLPLILSNVGALVVGFVLGYFSHGLTVHREADSRRRKFRDEIRSILLRFDGVTWMNFIETYSASVPEVKEACVKISEDVGFWKRRGFIKYRDKYCSLKQSDLELPRPRTPAGMEEYMKANAKKREEAKALLKDTLDRIIEHAI